MTTCSTLRAVLADRCLPGRAGERRGGREGRLHPLHPPAAEPLRQRSAENGLLIERMLEPAPPDGFLELAHEYLDAATIPRLLYLRTRKL